MSKKELTREEAIERSITKEFRFSIWSPFIAAIKRYKLLKPGDKVCVCISGGKDSNLLAECFKLLSRHSDFPFEVKYLVMNPGYSQGNLEKIKANLETMGIPAQIMETDIFEVANAQDHSPCYLCAKMRRGALYRLAQDMGCNKIALGHHYDDVIETILMNILHAGSYQTMLPKLHSDNFEGMELIRPLYLVREEDIKAWRDANALQFIQCACRFTENVAKPDSGVGSARLETKKLIQKLKETNPQVEKNIFKSAENIVLDKVIGYKDSEGHHSFLDTYEEEK